MEAVKKNGSTPTPLPDLEAEKAAAQATTAELVITLRADGSVGIRGPLHQKILCYGLMESAKQSIAAMPTSPIIGG